eukprot:scaffold98104_cov17-Prasinocladus_malaysianus.AAC.1
MPLRSFSAPVSSSSSEGRRCGAEQRSVIPRETFAFCFVRVSILKPFRCRVGRKHAMSVPDDRACVFRGRGCFNQFSPSLWGENVSCKTKNIVRWSQPP